MTCVLCVVFQEGSQELCDIIPSIDGVKSSRERTDIQRTDDSLDVLHTLLR